MIRRLLAGAARGPGVRLDPERVVLGVTPGMRPSPKPPVRIFLGTEPAQRRAERVFIWSVEKARDPSRVYEIYLMKELTGFHRLGWLTGFTQYRFAIPDFAGRRGRAIYNDVDQIYLADPANLFDADMDGQGFLAIDQRDSSVMLMDCERMASIWNWQSARQLGKRQLMRQAVDAQLWGPLSPEWNARDEEYEAGRSKLLHYTALHTQPWHPFPKQFTYQRSPVAEPWLALERSANVAGYHIFTAASPSRGFVDAIGRMHPSPDTLPRQEHIEEIRSHLGAGEASVLDYVGDRAVEPLSLGNRVEITQRCPTLAFADETRGPFDGIVCRDLLEHLPEEDVPWMLDEIFRRARRLVYLQIALGPHQPAALVESLIADVEAAASRHPRLWWKLVIRRQTRIGRFIEFVREGGCRQTPPTVWILTQGKPGHTIQSVGLATALGWPYGIKPDLATALAWLRSRFAPTPSQAGPTLHLAPGNGAGENWPWPDVIIATGWRPGNVARLLRRASRGRTRVVRIGRKASQVASGLDIVVSCAHFGLPQHPRRIEIVAPLNHISPERLAELAERGRQLFCEAPRPRIALLVGGSTVRHRLDESTARRLGEEVRSAAEAAGGHVFAITSRRTSPEAIDALRRALGDRGHLHQWKPGEKDNPYMAYLAAADAIVVTGESESMLAEAASSGRSVYIYPLPERAPSFWLRFNDWVLERAQSRRPNRRGTARPQQGFDYLCARLIAWGLLQPPRDLDALHRMLIDLGTARLFEGSIATGACTALRESEVVAAKVRRLLGFSEIAAGESATDSLDTQTASEESTDAVRAAAGAP